MNGIFEQGLLKKSTEIQTYERRAIALGDEKPNKFKKAGGAMNRVNQDGL